MRKRTWIVLAIGIAFAGFVFYLLLHVTPVEVTRSHLVYDNGQICVAGEVRDSSAKSVGTINLELHYFDRNGRPLGQDILTITGLKPRESRQFRGPLRDLAGVTDYSIYLNTGRNPYGN